MSDVVIRVENLSKKYTIRHAKVGGSGGDGLRHAISDAIAAPLRHLRLRSKLPSEPPTSEDFWALKDVSFEVSRGEVLGIIGRNGAGKSTLLKILSRITEPTSGRIGIKGRVASLLEVGTGFHPELSGRENIFLNGAILGMTRAEVKRKFDEIVDFSGIERFLDTPVKRYSSGMYVRLAFAVAAHLEPEILVIDEVLAVGDSEFQRRCLGKMQEVASGGHTILFVSHNLPSITALCDTGLLMKGGSVSLRGSADEIVSFYLTSHEEKGERTRRHGTGEYRFGFIRCEPQASQPDALRTFHFSFEKKGHLPGVPPFITLEILDESGAVVTRCDSRLTNDFLAGDGGKGAVVLRSPWLKPGMYSLNAYIDNGHNFIDVWEAATRFHVDTRMPYHCAVSADAYKRGPVLSDFSTQVVADR